MKILKFVKEDDENWYIDLPDWTGSKGALQMVAGADTLLDIFSEGANEVTLNVSEEAFDGYQEELLYLSSNSEEEPGGDYLALECGLDVWLCSVTEYVFGYYPEVLYIAKN